MDVAEKKNCHESIIMNKRTTIIGVSRRLFVTVAQCLTRVLYVLFGDVDSGQRSTKYTSSFEAGLGCGRLN